MNKLELLGIDQDVYFEKLDNGLEVYILPFENKNKSVKQLQINLTDPS